VKNPNTPVIQPSTKVMNKSNEQARPGNAAAESSKVGTGKFFVPSSASNGKVNATACTTSTTRLTDQLQRPTAHAPASEVIKTTMTTTHREKTITKESTATNNSTETNGHKSTLKSTTSPPPVLSVSGKQKCSHCLEELGKGAAMIIESLSLFYHLPCFRCYVCGVSLGSGVSGADVRVRAGKLHCHACYSNDEAGWKYSEV